MRGDCFKLRLRMVGVCHQRRLCGLLQGQPVYRFVLQLRQPAQARQQIRRSAHFSLPIAAARPWVWMTRRQLVTSSVARESAICTWV